MKTLLIILAVAMLGGCSSRCGPRYTYDLAKPIKVQSVVERKICNVTFVGADGEILEVYQTACTFKEGETLAE